LTLIDNLEKMALGAVGIIIPVLPTTPFVLLAAGCFSASWPKAHRLLLRNRFFAPYIEHYKSGGGITRSAKARGIIVLWLLLAISMLAVGKLWLLPVLGAVGIGVTLHLLLIKTRPVVHRRDEGEIPKNLPEDG
jgi:uncharacterized membrane protein YbaN (DUF454 family)